MAQLVTLGELLVEFVSVDSRGHPVPLPTRPGLFAGPFPSGAPAIFIDQAARFGVDTAMLGAVGADIFGDGIVRRLQGSGTDTSAIRRIGDRPTGTAHVGYNPDGSRDFVFHLAESAADYVTVESARELTRGADVLHLSGASFGASGLRAAALAAMETARQNGIPLSFDPNIRAELFNDPLTQAAVAEALRQAHWLFPSEDDLSLLSPGIDPLDAARQIAETAPVVVLTRAERGAILIEKTRELRQAAFEVDVADPTGAGDAFAAAFISVTLQGDDPEMALRLAAAAGAHATSALGAMEGSVERGHVASFADASSKRPA